METSERNFGGAIAKGLSGPLGKRLGRWTGAFFDEFVESSTRDFAATSVVGLDEAVVFGGGAAGSGRGNFTASTAFLASERRRMVKPRSCGRNYDI